jgi:hypothetical protein
MTTLLLSTFLSGALAAAAKQQAKRTRIMIRLSNIPNDLHQLLIATST